MSKPLSLSSIARVSALLAVPAIAYAHPGHDGHELTWDFGHLVAHPLATLSWFVALGAGIWALRRFVLKVGRGIPDASTQKVRHR
jgi:hydrogenase/urease accessory protein HupE